MRQFIRYRVILKSARPSTLHEKRTQAHTNTNISSTVLPVETKKKRSSEQPRRNRVALGSAHKNCKSADSEVALRDRECQPHGRSSDCHREAIILAICDRCFGEAAIRQGSIACGRPTENRSTPVTSLHGLPALENLPLALRFCSGR